MSTPVFKTLGCRLNAYETEAMKTLATGAGLENAAVINTCAVTAEAVRTARQQIRKLHREDPDRPILVTGCAAQTEAATFAEMPEVTRVIGNVEKLEAKTWAGISAGQGSKVAVRDIMAETQANAPLIDGLGTRARAYIQVQNGCDHRCTFCIIPYGRGNSRSVPAEQAVEQAKRLVAKGFNEIVLTGVDMTSWGADLDGKPGLGVLVKRLLAEVPDLPRLRISSIDSIEADEDLVEALATENRLMPHLHLSLQAGDDMVLKRMKRRHLRDDAIAFCERVRKLRPDITYGADIIAGFPTETEAMFENSLALVKDCGLTWLHVFPYSIRQGTPAARMPQVDKHAIKDRAARLRTTGDLAVEAYLQGQVGQTKDVLIEKPQMGRSPGFAPVEFAKPQPVGQIIRTQIASTTANTLVAK